VITDPDSDSSVGRAERQPQTDRADYTAVMRFEMLADVANRLAQAVEENALLRERAAEHLDNRDQVLDRAAQSRRLADALRAAADAFQAHRVPSADIRRTIRGK
jgi:hypothetical protein